MNSDLYSAEKTINVDVRRGVIRWGITAVLALVLMAATLFLYAGTLDWWLAWVYILTAAIIQFLNAVVLIPISPDLLSERSRYQ